MKEAKVKYNDFTGTVAADGIDPYNREILIQYLQSKGVDTSVYKPIGFDFFSGEAKYCDFDIICINLKLNELIKIGFEKKQSLEEFFNLFKRFRIIGSLEDSSLDINSETLIIDDRDIDNY